MQIDSGNGRHRLCLHPLAVQPAAVADAPLHRLPAQKDVPRDAHARNHRVVLMDGFYAQAHRVFRRTDVHRLAQKLDRAGIRAVRARKDLDQGRLAGTVVAEQADDLPLPDVEADIAQRVHARVPLVQSGAADQHILARPRLDRSPPRRPGCDARRRAAAGRQGNGAPNRNLIFLAMSRRWLLAITAQMVSAPMANLNQLASTSETTMPLSIARIRTTPITAPSTVPPPPPRAVPPITAAATACNSRPSPREGSGEPSRMTCNMPAKPASTEHSTKQLSLTRSVRMPMACAASGMPPVARIQLP